MDEFQFYRDQLWTAPELLRMTTRPINGTQKADVYSFAIILQEIMFRAEPYFIGMESPTGKFVFTHSGMLNLMAYFKFVEIKTLRFLWIE